ncbi:M23 family metallopeptidase [Cytobacillus kochii]|uniref:M23 family metallopeptidase n=1 Tax=Cytobacillus kochii TaxID=859143 RepID=UPI00402A9D7D
MITKTIGGFKVTTPYGVIDQLHKTPHNGIDLALPEGSPLYAIGRGVVEDIVNYGDSNIGQGVIVKLDNGLKAVYGHLSQVKVNPGDHLEAGQLLALSGNTGRSTGPHLHFTLKDGVQTVDPTKYVAGAVEKHNRWLPDFIEKPYTDLTNALNDFNGTVDTLSYWLNPKNLFSEIWQGLEALIYNPETAVFLMAAAIISIIFRGLEVKLPLKLTFWSWVAYWILRGFIFV